ncbi:hypothetical protein CBS101457_001080 [Exobasidium rhododendri]|nr:hypothetical protein CBS101457_001080 [Exobasidium rhododendri]
MSSQGRPSIDDTNEDQPLLGQQEDEDANDTPFYQRILTPLKHPESLRPLEKALLLVSLVLLLLFAAFVGLYAGAKSRLGHLRPPPGSPGMPGDELPCTTRHCVLTASGILNSLDTTVDPCDDFYQFSVGNWLRDHPIPGDAGLFGMAQYITANNARSIRRLLESQEDTPSHLVVSEDAPSAKVDERNLKKLRNFYQSCMDRETQDEMGATPVLDMVDELSGRLRGTVEDFNTTLLSSFALSESIQLDHGIYDDGPVPPNRPPAREPKHHSPTTDPSPLPPLGGRQTGFTQALAWAHTKSLPILFQWYTDGEPVDDPNLGTAYLAPSGLGFPNKAYYTDADELEFYESVIFDSLVLLDKAEKKHHKDRKGKDVKGASVSSLRKLAKLIVEFEKDLAKITPDNEDLEDPLLTYNPIKISSLSYSFTSIDWSEYMKLLAIRSPESVIVKSPKFMKSLDSLVSRTKTEVLVGYFAWSVLRVTGLQLGPNVPLRGPIDSLDRRSKGVEPDAKEDRAGLCLDSLNSHLGFLAGRFFVKEAFSPQAKKVAENIIAAIIVAFKERLPELDWLDSKTRAKAEVKADAVNIKVAYPDSYPNTTDASDVERFYADLDVKEGDYFGNIVRSWSRASKTGWRKVGRELNRGRWDMFPAEVNAYYNPGGNEIVFPAGILQPEYFSEYWPTYMQFGAFGCVSGHELSHAFDPSGRLFDEEGRLKDWWTNDTAAAFNERRDCLIDQYAQFTIPDGKGGKENLRSRFTIGEDVADAGGLAQSYRAWQDHLANGGDKLESNALLPGVSLTREQLFFFAYARGWARNIRTQEAIRRLRTDEHSPTKYRVIGPLSNMPEFAQAFGCKAGVDRMARSENDRCKIW